METITKHVPTDEELNRHVAELLGWETGVGSWGKNPQGQVWPVPRYCTDRNALPELWAKVREKGGSHAYRGDVSFIRELGNTVGTLPTDGKLAIWAYQLLTAPPRLHVIAALKALNAWKPEWEQE